MSWCASRLGHYCDRCDGQIRLSLGRTVYLSVQCYGPREELAPEVPAFPSGWQFCEGCVVSVVAALAAVVGAARRAERGVAP